MYMNPAAPAAMSAASTAAATHPMSQQEMLLRAG
jgi:hypothetical protein